MTVFILFFEVCGGTFPPNFTVFHRIYFTLAPPKMFSNASDLCYKYKFHTVADTLFFKI